MPLLNSIWSDLREKRLWPVAVVLVVALVVIGVLSVGGGSAAPAPRPAVSHPAAITAPGGIAVTPAGPNAAAAIVATAGGASLQRNGHAHNPFVVQPGVNLNPASGASAAAKTTAAAGGAGSPASTPASASKTTTTGASTTAPSQTSTTTTSAPTVAAKPAYHVTLKFGFPSALQTYTDVAKLTTLPSAQNAVLAFLGVRSNGKTVTFAVLQPAVLTGPANCRPSRARCQQFDMRQGQTELLDYVTPQLTAVRLQLNVVSVAKKSAAAIPAKAANGRQLHSGRAVLRRAAPAILRGLRYSQVTGTLVGGPRAQSASVSTPSQQQLRDVKPAFAPAWLGV